MCGRFTYRLTWPEIVKLYRLTLDYPARNTQARYNICPTTTIDTILDADAERKLVPMRWGLIPSWWQKPLKDMKLATFSGLNRSPKNQCSALPSSIIAVLFRLPATNEWHDTPDGKQPYCFTRRDGQPVTIAGLWDEWTDRFSVEQLKSCAMVITEPNTFVAEIHDRMPVILEAKDFEQWEQGDVKDAAALMKPADEDILQRWPVSKRVNSSRASDVDATLIDPDERIATSAEIMAVGNAIAHELGQFGVKRK